MESAPDSARERRPAPPPVAPAWHAVSRGVALFLAVFTLLNLAGELRFSGLDADFWWIDLRPAPPEAARGFLAWVSVVLVVFAVRPQIDGAFRNVALFSVALLLTAALWNVYTFYAAVRTGGIQSDLPIPFALHAAAGLVVVFAGIRESPQHSVHVGRDVALAAAAFAVCAVSFPLVQIFCDGKIEHLSPADAVIVFVESNAEVDSESGGMQAAGRLYRDGLVPKLIVVRTPISDSAPPGFQAAPALDTELGVPPADWSVIAVSDPASVVEEVAGRCVEMQIGSAAIVTQFYESPWLEMAFRRQGLRVSTVPATSGKSPEQMPGVLAKEVAKLWALYVSPLLQ